MLYGDDTFIPPADPKVVQREILTSKLKGIGISTGWTLLRPYIKPYLETSITTLISTVLSTHIGLIAGTSLNWLIYSTLLYTSFSQFLCFWISVCLNLYINSIYDTHIVRIVKRYVPVDEMTEWILLNGDANFVKMVKTCFVVVSLLYIWTALLVVTFTNRLLALGTLRFIVCTIINETLIVKDGDYSVATTRLWKWITSKNPRIVFYAKKPLNVIKDDDYRADDTINANKPDIIITSAADVNITNKSDQVCSDNANNGMNSSSHVNVNTVTDKKVISNIVIRNRKECKPHQFTDPVDIDWPLSQKQD